MACSGPVRLLTTLPLHCAGNARRTLLLRLCAFRHEPPPPSLCALLCDGAILKAGVGVVADLVRLEAALGLAVTRGGVELASVVALDPALHGMAGGLPALAPTLEPSLALYANPNPNSDPYLIPTLTLTTSCTGWQAACQP